MRPMCTCDDIEQTYYTTPRAQYLPCRIYCDEISSNYTNYMRRNFYQVCQFFSRGCYINAKRQRGIGIRDIICEFPRIYIF